MYFQFKQVSPVILITTTGFQPIFINIVSKAGLVFTPPGGHAGTDSNVNKVKYRAEKKRLY